MLSTTIIKKKSEIRMSNLNMNLKPAEFTTFYPVIHVV